MIRSRLSDPESLRLNIAAEDLVVGGLNSHTVTVSVRGSAKKGVRPYVQLDKVRYTSPKLSSRPDMIALNLIVNIDAEDYRKVAAYLPSGIFFDDLKALGAWGREKHSVMTRKIVNRALTKKTFTINASESVVTAWRSHLEHNRTKRNNLELLRLQKELSAESSCSTGVIEILDYEEAAQASIDLSYELSQVLTPGESV